jgi:ankyrin repeat protein
MAATLRRDVKMIRLLLELGASPDVENFDGWSARKWAAAEANRALMDVFGLLKEEEETAATQVVEVPASKPTSSVSNDAFWTAFMRAACMGDAPSLRRLVDDGVEINGQSPNGTTALIAAAKNGKKDSVLELIELGADLNLFDEEGLTAIAWAAKNGQTMIVQALKEKGAGDPDLNDGKVTSKSDDATDAPSA